MAAEHLVASSPSAYQTRKIMLSQETSPLLIETALSEMQSLTLNLYTPMSRQEWERNTAIVEKVLNEVFGA